MSSNNSSANVKKAIAQIYSAIDSHSYSKAVKLCQNLPSDNVLGQSLLAHAYAKLVPPNRYKSLETIYVLLSTCTSEQGTLEWPELERELKYAIPMERRNNEGSLSPTASAASSNSSKPSSRPSGKKSKGKKTLTSQPSKSSYKRIDISSIVPQDWDWIDVLEQNISTIELSIIPMPKSQIVFGSRDDATIRHTLSATLKVLRMPITAYQLNCHCGSEETIWEHGLAVWMRQSHLGNTEQDDKWLESLLPDARKRQWEKRKSNENDEIAKKVQILQNIGRNNDAVSLLQDTLLQYPDDWEYWDLLFTVDSGTSAEAFLADSITKHPELRGPRLMELKRNPSPRLCMDYGDRFCERALCAHSDILEYLRAMQGNELLIQWSRELTSAGLDCDEAAQWDSALRRRKLRRFIFGVKVQFTLLETSTNKSDLIDWKALVKQWKIYKDSESKLDHDQAQKEDRPPDELIILAVQSLLVDLGRNLLENFVQDDAVVRKILIALSLLEAAIEYSPHNFKLKLAAIELYSAGFHATYRAWGLYQELFLKHIQHETCSHIILRHLLSSGLFDEAFKVCRSIQDFHIKSSRELQEGVKQAMENGNIGKADEFMQFHKTKLQPSLILQQAKALTMDLSPLLPELDKSHCGSTTAEIRRLGERHGIVGSTDDMIRATEMISAAHNPASALDALQFSHPAASKARSVDNRDNSIRSYDILGSIYVLRMESDESIWSSNIHRSLQHSLLVRATLLADGCKGLRKGKVVPCSSVLRRRCSGLWDKLQQTRDFMDNSPLSSVYLVSLKASVALCRAMLSLGGGVDKAGEFVLDDLDSRERSSLLFLDEARVSIRSIYEVPELNDICRLSNFLVDCCVHLFSLARIFSTIAESYGFGNRKRQTKPVAGAVADISDSFCRVVECLQSIADQSLSHDLTLHESFILDQTRELVHPNFVKQTIKHVAESRTVAKNRLLSYLKYMKQEMGSLNDNE